MDIRKEGNKKFKKLKVNYKSDLFNLFLDQIIDLSNPTSQPSRLVGISVLSRCWLALHTTNSIEYYEAAPGTGEVLMKGLGIPCTGKLDDPSGYIAELELLIKRISEMSIPIVLTRNDEATTNLFQVADCLYRRWYYFSSSCAFEKYQRSLGTQPSP